MKVIMTGGGTGGHIYPAIAIADRIRQESPGAQILFIGTRRGKESELVPAAGYPIRFIKVRGLDRRNMAKNFAVLKDFALALRESRKIIDEFKPDLVIGTGGYVSAPVLQAAGAKKIPYYIQEQNALPGLANRMLESGARKVFLGFAEGSGRLRHPEKHIHTGNPVRQGFYEADRNACRAALGIPEGDFVLLAFGGSQGAGRINKAMTDVVRRYNGQAGVTVIFVPGPYYYLPIVTELADQGVQPADNIRIHDYVRDMDKVLPAADLVVSRSGALTVSELAVCGKASILIPSPIVTGDHQKFNAGVLADRGAAVLLEEKDLDSDRLFDEIEAIRTNGARRAEMETRARGAAPEDATLAIWREISR
jgi:UDP-N-acetylglucosamine--N-acetylmuramyl-(pentapeptide) pyrophosphoryl-undecaprenol N-acetylglucosamine transferase